MNRHFMRRLLPILLVALTSGCSTYHRIPAALSRPVVEQPVRVVLVA